MVMNVEWAMQHGVPQHSPCTVPGFYGDGSIALIGPDGKQLLGAFRPGHLVVAEEAGWLPLHYAVALECGDEVVAALLEAHREVRAWQWCVEGGVLLQ